MLLASGTDVKARAGNVLRAVPTAINSVQFDSFTDSWYRIILLLA